MELHNQTDGRKKKSLFSQPMKVSDYADGDCSVLEEMQAFDNLQLLSYRLFERRLSRSLRMSFTKILDKSPLSSSPGKHCASTCVRLTTVIYSFFIDAATRRSHKDIGCCYPSLFELHSVDRPPRGRQRKKACVASIDSTLDLTSHLIATTQYSSRRLVRVFFSYLMCSWINCT